MKRLIFQLFILVFFFQCIPLAKASHILSAELGWTCVGQDSFMIRLTVYIDCNASTAPSWPVDVTCAQTGFLIRSISFSASAPVDVTPVCRTSCTRCQSLGCSFPYGIHRYSFLKLVVLSNTSCCQIKLKWSECCRSNSITTGAWGANFYTEATFDRCQNTPYSTPTFDDPVQILCVAQNFSWAIGTGNNSLATNDSVTYEWAEPLSGANSPISYSGSYAYDKPVYFWGFPNANLPFPRGFQLDPRSGDIQFRPMKAEVTVMAVKQKIYRNQVQIAEIRREMFCIVITCSNNNPPLVTTPNNVGSKIICGGDSVGFDFTTNDPNSSDSITISSYNIPPGAVWTHTNGQSKHPSARLSWKTTNQDASSLPYCFYVKVMDNACPVRSAFTQTYTITVDLKLNSKIKVTDLGCGLYHFGLDSFYKQTLVYTLDVAGKKYWLDTSHTYQFSGPGTYPYKINVSYSKGCNSITDSGIIQVDTFISVQLPVDTFICRGSTLNIEPRLYNAKGTLKYLWSTGDTTRILHTGPQNINNRVIDLSVSDTTGCIAKDNIMIKLLPEPKMLPADTTICYGSTFSIEPKTAFTRGAVSYMWSNGDTDRILHTNRFFNNTGITLILKDSTGCTAENSILIKTKENYYMIPPDRNICSGNSTEIDPNVNFTKGHVAYNWSTGDTNKILKTGPLYKDLLISLIILDSAGCTVQDYIFITVLRNPEISMSKMLNICNYSFTSITPYVQVFGSQNSILSSFWHRSGDYSGITYNSPLKTKDSGVFIFTIVDYYGCSDSDSVQVGIFPLIDTSLSVKGSTLTAMNGMKRYIWYWNDHPVSAGISNVYIAKSLGWYFASVTDNNDCIDSTRSVFINPAGISDPSVRASMRLYPNPTTGKIILEPENPINNDIDITVWSFLGKEILHQHYKANQSPSAFEIDLSDLPAGAYTITIRYQNKISHQTLLKE